MSSSYEYNKKIRNYKQMNIKNRNVVHTNKSENVIQNNFIIQPENPKNNQIKKSRQGNKENKVVYQVINHIPPKNPKDLNNMIIKNDIPKFNNYTQNIPKKTSLKKNNKKKNQNLNSSKSTNISQRENNINYNDININNNSRYTLKNTNLSQNYKLNNFNKTNINKDLCVIPFKIINNKKNDVKNYTKKEKMFNTLSLKNDNINNNNNNENDSVEEIDELIIEEPTESKENKIIKKDTNSFLNKKEIIIRKVSKKEENQKVVDDDFFDNLLDDDINFNIDKNKNKNRPFSPPISKLVEVEQLKKSNINEQYKKCEGKNINDLIFDDNKGLFIDPKTNAYYDIKF